MLLLVIGILLPLMISPTTVEAVVLDDLKFKVVVTFELDVNPNTLRGLYQTQVVPAFDTIFDDLGANFFDKTGEGLPNNPFGYSSEIHVTSFHTFGTNPQSADTVFQIYPLVRVTGDNPNLTEPDFNVEVNTVVALMRIEIINFLQAQGATNVHSTLHFTFGGVDFDEGF